MKKASEYRYLEAFNLSNGRCERIRTFDPLHPMQVRYQAAPHTDSALNYSLSFTLKLGSLGEKLSNFKQFLFKLNQFHDRQIGVVCQAAVLKVV
jgi:hypothetical protein